MKRTFLHSDCNGGKSRRFGFHETRGDRNVCYQNLIPALSRAGRLGVLDSMLLSKLQRLVGSEADEKGVAAVQC